MVEKEYLRQILCLSYGRGFCHKPLKHGRKNLTVHKNRQQKKHGIFVPNINLSPRCGFRQC